MPILDANVILRYLLHDIPDMADEARDVIISGAATTIEVLSEVVYVLKGVYGAERQQISETMESFMQEITVPHKTALQFAFRLYGKSNLDFVDCVLAGYHYMENAEILTFDKKLQNVLMHNPL